MRTSKTISALVFVMLLAMFCFQNGKIEAYAAEEAPHIGYVYPFGGSQGQKLTVTIGGQFLSDVSDIHFSCQGLSAKLLNYKKVLEPKEIRRLMRRIEIFEARRDSADAQKKDWIEKKLREYHRLLNMQALPEDPLAMKKRLRTDPRKQPNVQLSEQVCFDISIDADAECGQCEIRILTRRGFSNPLNFQIGSLAERNEKEPNDRLPQAMLLDTMPLTINGQMMPGDEDLFRFRARKGQNLVISVKARQLIPYLADAVPGWFQAVLTLYDGNGKELAYVDDFRIDPDPVLFHRVEHDGEYVLAIRDAIHRGREDFIYRISLGELPFISSIFPLGGPRKKATRVKLYGENLSRAELTLKPDSADPNPSPLSVSNDRIRSNLVLFAIDSLPEIVENEDNSDRVSAEKISLPVVINGTIQEPGDRDYFHFNAQAGDEIAIEVLARRLGSPLDSVLVLTDSNGNIMAQNDDYNDLSAGLVTHQADAYLKVRIADTGSYYVQLKDVQQKGSRAHAYRLRISHPRPDFTLRVTPSSMSIPRGGTVPITLHAIRKDGFKGDIRLRFAGLTHGFQIDNPIIQTGQEKVRLTISASSDVAEGPYLPRIFGQARINGKLVEHPAVAAEDMMQAFLWRFIVPARELCWYVRGRSLMRVTADISKDETILIPRGGSARINLRTPRINAIMLKRAQDLELVLNDPPRGLSVKKTGLFPELGEPYVIVQADAETSNPPPAGNLIFDGVFKKRSKKNAAGTNAPHQVVFTTPAIAYRLVP